MSCLKATLFVSQSFKQAKCRCGRALKCKLQCPVGVSSKFRSCQHFTKKKKKKKSRTSSHMCHFFSCKKYVKRIEKLFSSSHFILNRSFETTTRDSPMKYLISSTRDFFNPWSLDGTFLVQKMALIPYPCLLRVKNSTWSFEFRSQIIDGTRLTGAVVSFQSIFSLTPALQVVQVMYHRYKGPPRRTVYTAVVP